MASVGIVGESGTGKSTSIGSFPEYNIQGLNSKETVYINVSGKDLPFRGWKKLYTGKISEGGNYVETANHERIAKAVENVSKNRPDIKNIVIDDAQYIMAFEFMARAKESGYNKFADLGVQIGNIIKAARECRNDLKVYFLWHPEKDKELGYKMKTVGSN